jgi:hypothetical protein
VEVKPVRKQMLKFQSERENCHPWKWSAHHRPHWKEAEPSVEIGQEGVHSEDDPEQQQKARVRE